MAFEGSLPEFGQLPDGAASKTGQPGGAVSLGEVWLVSVLENVVYPWMQAVREHPYLRQLDLDKLLGLARFFFGRKRHAQ